MPLLGMIGYRSGVEFQKTLNSLVAKVTYETWYNSKIHINNDLHIGIGWTYDKGSFSDCMPIYNETRDLILILAGECYLDASNKQALRSKGHAFNDQDASYLIHIYEEDPECFFSILNGRYCGVIIDSKQDMVILFNDRFGMGRIYYHEDAGKFIFSTELKSILHLHPELRTINDVSFGEYLSCDCVFDNRTLFDNIFLLPGGSKWTFRKGFLEKKEKYFDPKNWESCEILDDEVFYDKLGQTFSSILPKYFNSPPKIGFSLTGGIDSRMILAVKDFPNNTIPFYTFGSMYNENRDVKIARQLAKHCRQTHSIISIGKEFLNQFSSLAEKTVYITDGGLDVTGAAELYVNRLAREIAQVRMTGNYGQEVLNWDRAFKPTTASYKFLNADFLQSAQAAQKTFKDSLGVHPLTFITFKQAPWYHYRRLALEQSQLILRTPFMDNDIVKLMYQASPNVTKNRNLCMKIIRDSNPEIARIMTDRGFLGRSERPSKLIRGYYEVQFKLEYWFDYGMPQWLMMFNNLSRSLNVEKKFLGQHKICHFRVWYRDELSNYVKAILLDRRTLSRPYLDAKSVETLVENHLKGLGNHTVEITKLLTLELMHRTLIEQ